VLGYRTGHWVVERTNPWMNSFQRLPVRWEKKAANHVAILHFAGALITFRWIWVFGQALLTKFLKLAKSELEEPEQAAAADTEFPESVATLARCPVEA